MIAKIKSYKYDISNYNLSPYSAYIKIIKNEVECTDVSEMPTDMVSLTNKRSNISIYNGIAMTATLYRDEFNNLIKFDPYTEGMIESSYISDHLTETETVSKSELNTLIRHKTLGYRNSYFTKAKSKHTMILSNDVTNIDIKIKYTKVDDDILQISYVGVINNMGKSKKYKITVNGITYNMVMTPIELDRYIHDISQSCGDIYTIETEDGRNIYL